MSRRWLSCTQMWSDFERGQVFTAGNTTTNRIESHWGHTKAGMGKVRRIDLCLEAILMRDVAVLRREVTLLTSKTRIYEADDYFIRRTLQSLSASRAAIVRNEWIAYRARHKSFKSETDVATGEVTVYPTRFSTVEFVVRVGASSCTCRFACSNGLPCRHLFYVAQQLNNAFDFPRTSLLGRWSVGDYANLVPALKTAIEGLEMVRISKLPGRHSVDKPSHAPVPSPTRRHVDKISWVRHQKGEVPVIGAVEKRNIVHAQCDRLIRRLMDLGTVAFWAASVDLEAVIKSFIGRLDGSVPNSVLVASLASPRPSPPAAPTAAGQAVEVQSAAAQAVEVQSAASEHRATADSAATTYGGGRDMDTRDPLADGAVMEEADGSECVDIVVGGSQCDRAGPCGEFAVSSMEAVQSGPSTGESPNELDGAGGSDSSFGEADDYDYGEDNASDDYSSGSDNEYEMFEDDDCIEPDCEPDVDSYQHPARIGSRSNSLDLLDVHSFECGATSVSTPLHSPNAVGLALVAAFETVEVESSSSPTAVPKLPSVVYPVKWTGFMADISADLLADGCERLHDAELPRHLDHRAGASLELVRGRTKQPRDLEDVPDPPSVKRLRIQKTQLSEPGRLYTKQYKLPVARKGTPHQKKQLSRGKVRSISQPSTLVCPVSVVDFVALLFTTPVAEVFDLAELYPPRYNELSLSAKMVTVVAREPRTTTNVAINYRHSPGAVDNMAAAIEKFRDGCNAEGDEMLYFAKVFGVADEVSEASLAALAAYYELRTFKGLVEKDLRWLGDTLAWRTVDKNASTQFMLDTNIPDRFSKTDADTVLARVLSHTIDMYKSLTLMTSLTVKRSSVAYASPRSAEVGARVIAAPRIEAREIFGRLDLNTWLDDTVINFALRTVTAAYADVAVVDPACIGTSVGLPIPVRSTRVAVFPVNLEQKHWCLICVEFDWERRGHVVFAYDPLNEETWQAELRHVWDVWCEPVLISWHITTSASFEYDRWQWVTSPTQPDTPCCGVFILSMAQAFIEGRVDFQELATVSVPDAQVLRLHWLHTILSRSIASYVAPSTNQYGTRRDFTKWAKAANTRSKAGQTG